MEGSYGAARPPVRAIGLVAGALAAVVSAALLVDGREASDDAGGAAARARPGPEVLSSRPLSTRAAERRLEARFTELRDDDSAAARCSSLQPRPAHAIRRCRIRYPHGIERTVIVLTNPEGRELIVRR